LPALDFLPVDEISMWSLDKS